MIDYFTNKSISTKANVHEIIYAIKKDSEDKINYKTAHTLTNAYVEMVVRNNITNEPEVLKTTYDNVLNGDVYYIPDRHLAFTNKSLYDEIVSNLHNHRWLHEHFISKEVEISNYTSVLNYIMDEFHYSSKSKDITSFYKENPNIQYISGLKSKTFFLTEKKRYSFGIELESSGGFAPSYLWSNKYDVCAARDGSITGKEYITCPLTGDDGLMALQYICNEIDKHCHVDKNCGLHCHINSGNLNKEEIVFLFILLKKLENDIFNILPLSRRKNEMCRKIKNNINFDINGNETSDEYKMKISRCYDSIFQLYHGIYKTDKNHNKSQKHEKGPKVGYDRSQMRYSWVNFVPTLMKCRDSDKYNTGIHTIEFRCHEGTFDYEKIKNWVLILLGIIHYSENNKKNIIYNIPINIEDVIKYSYPKTYKYLIQYIRKRRLNQNDDLTENKQFTLKELINKHKLCA